MESGTFKEETFVQGVDGWDTIGLVPTRANVCCMHENACEVLEEKTVSLGSVMGEIVSPKKEMLESKPECDLI